MSEETNVSEELTGDELRERCELFGHPMMGNACPCGRVTDWRGL